MVRVALIGIPLVVAALAVGLAALLLPACAVGSLAGACPPVAAAAPQQRVVAEAARRAALEAEIVALQRRVAALPQCPMQQAAAPARDIQQERWEQRDIGLLEGCWQLDSDYTMRRVGSDQTVRVQDWQMCFDARGRGEQTQVFTDGTRCAGPTQAAFAADGQLAITEAANVPCRNGFIDFIYRRNARCVLTDDGRARCSVVHPELSGSPPYDVVLRR